MKVVYKCVYMIGGLSCYKSIMIIKIIIIIIVIYKKRNEKQ